MDLGLKGKTAVIIGGTTGIGRSAALRFLEEGCCIAVCSHNTEKTEAFLAELGEEERSKTLVRVVNATKAEELEAFAKETEERFGGIDLWVNCAGGNKWAPVDDLDEEIFDWIVELNLKTVYLGIKTAAKYLKKRGGGSIVSISSLSSKVPVAYRGTYGAAKAGVNLLTKSAAAELAPFGIRVNAVAPGTIDTILSRKAVHEEAERTKRMVPLRRAGQPEEVGDVIVCLSGSAFSYVTGTVIEIDGGKDTVEDADLPFSEPWKYSEN